MPGTIDDLIASIEVEREAAIKRGKKAGAEIQLILDKAQQDGRSSSPRRRTTASPNCSPPATSPART